MNVLVSSFVLVHLALVSLVAGVPDYDPVYSDIEDGADFEEQLEENNVFDAVGGLEAVQMQFNGFIEKYSKVYVSRAEKQKRLQIFAQNLKEYKELNERDRGTAVYGVTKYSDWSAEEFRSRFMNLRRPKNLDGTKNVYDGPELRKKTDKSIDWREKGAVSPVKDQGNCGSCWAFSAVANLEGLHYIKHKKLELFSEQQIVDCDDKSGGCRGGWMTYACDYVKKAGGLEKASDYPYKGYDDQCAFNSSKVALQVEAVVYLPRNERKIANYLLKHGPVSVALDASAMKGYLEGVARPPESLCGKREEDLNHAVTLVGFGVKVVKDGNKKKRLPFWIIKNSWGLNWGSKGYYYLYRGEGTCGIHLEASSAKLR